MEREIFLRLFSRAPSMRREEACAEAGVETAALRAESGAPEEVR